MDESGRWYVGDEVAEAAFKSGPKAAQAARDAAVGAASYPLGDSADGWASRTPAERGADAVSVKELGAKGDSDVTGSTGTDDHAALQLVMDAIAAGTISSIFFPPGYYKSSGVLTASAATLLNIHIEGHGARIVFTPAAATSKLYFRLCNSSNLGQVCVVDGLELDHNRDTTRSSNCDMLSIAGFMNTRVQNVIIPSADNMGVAIGRSATGLLPDSIHVLNCVIGGKAATVAHSNGSIGDSGIWLTNVGVRTIVQGNTVSSTGDDAIAVAEQNQGSAANVTIAGNRVLNSGSRGILCSVPGAMITGNYIYRTNNAGIALVTLGDPLQSRAKVSGNSIYQAGRMQAGEIGTSMITKGTPYGIIVQGQGSDIEISNNLIKDAQESGVLLFPSGGGHHLSLHQGKHLRQHRQRRCGDAHDAIRRRHPPVGDRQRRPGVECLHRGEYPHRR